MGTNIGDKYVAGKLNQMANASSNSAVHKEEKNVRGELDRVEERQPRERIPFGVPRSKLAVHGEIPGYHIQWINDTGGRIEEAQAGGFSFVSRNELQLAPGHSLAENNSDLGDRISMVVGTIKNTGAGYRAYLMKIRNEHKDEDRKILSDRRKARMDSIKRGQVTPLDRNFYVPDSTPIRISNRNS